MSCIMHFAQMTFATPHVHPVLPYDQTLMNFYAQTSDRAEKLLTTALLSVGGGSQVRI